MRTTSMKKIWVSLLVVASMLVYSVLPVFAANQVTVENPDTGYNATTDVTLTVTAEMLGEDVVVTVPSAITITASDSRTVYPNAMDSNMDNFGKQSIIIMKGLFESPKELYVGVASNNELTNSEDSRIKVPCKTTVITNGYYNGETASGVNVVYFSKDSSSVASSTTSKVDFRVMKNDIMSVGTYTGTVNYYIAIASSVDDFLALF